MQQDDSTQGEKISESLFLFYMDIKRIVCGMFETNSYMLEDGEYALLVDPASKAEKMIDLLGDKKLIGILLTHGHFDHIKAVDGLFDKYNCPIYLNKLDEELVKDKHAAESFRITNCPTVSKPITFLSEGEMNIGPFKFDVIFTPGHTEGSVCYKFENDIFTGDTLFRCSVGRTDLKGGDNSKLKSSLRIIKNISENLIVHPGHEEESSLDYERLNNPYLYNL